MPPNVPPDWATSSGWQAPPPDQPPGPPVAPSPPLGGPFDAPAPPPQPGPPPGWAPGPPGPPGAPKSTSSGLIVALVVSLLAVMGVVGFVLLDDGSENTQGDAAQVATPTTEPGAEDAEGEDDSSFGDGVEGSQDGSTADPEDETVEEPDDATTPAPGGDGPEEVVVRMLTTPRCEDTAELVARDSLDSYWARCVDGTADSQPVTELRSETDDQATVVVTRVTDGLERTSDVTLILEDGAWKISYWGTDGSVWIEPSRAGLSSHGDEVRRRWMLRR